MWVSMEARSLSFSCSSSLFSPCSSHRFRISRRCPLRVCVRERRSIPCVFSKPASPGNSSSSPEFRLVSTTECSDGSVVFHFGDVREAEGVDVEMEELEGTGDDVDQVASTSFSSEDRKTVYLREVLHVDHKKEVAGGNFNHTTKEKAESHSVAEYLGDSLELIDDETVLTRGDYPGMAEVVSLESPQSIATTLEDAGSNVATSDSLGPTPDCLVSINSEGRLMETIEQEPPASIGLSELNDAVDDSMLLNQDESLELNSHNIELGEMPGISGEEQDSAKSSDEREEISRTEFCLNSGAASLPHPSKVLTGGEDSHFITKRSWLGVADGTGKWTMEGTNAGLFAQGLMDNCREMVSATESNALTDPIDVIFRGAAATRSIGLCTVLIACFDGQVLHVASIGNSGYIIIRDGMIYKRSSPMVHEFNFPVLMEGGDTPSELMECYSIELDEGDVIVSATDGLFDNLYEQEIASIVRKSLQSGSSPQDVAELLATRAQEVGQSKSARTPFADAAHAAGYVGYTGGKLDDVTVVVSMVEKRSSSRL
ncbi:hypothetical protein NL676_015989 [Syzygium grande]|nr:hypothetical protein NL676_015989 [Syzygium grande]